MPSNEFEEFTKKLNEALKEAEAEFLERMAAKQEQDQEDEVVEKVDEVIQEFVKEFEALHDVEKLRFDKAKFEDIKKHAEAMSEETKDLIEKYIEPLNVITREVAPDLREWEVSFKSVGLLHEVTSELIKAKMNEAVRKMLFK